MDVTVELESPYQPAITEMINYLDSYLSKLYPPESNHFTDLKTLSDSNAIFCVARKSIKPIGCGAAIIKYDGDHVYAEIKRMFVYQRYRSQGVGYRILDFLHKKIGEKGITISRLETGFSQVDAIRLYETFGYYLIPPFGEYQLDPLSVFYERRI